MIDGNAIEYEDYVPCSETLHFANGETEKVITIKLVNEKMPRLMDNKGLGEINDGSFSQDDQGEVSDVMFKVKIFDAKPEGVNISKKNVAIVTIKQTEDDSEKIEDEQKMLTYFLASKEPSWSQQFKNAVMLGPSIDEDNMIIDHVTMSEALWHFACIGWKIIFAVIPPSNYWGGWAAFIVALALIGLVTAIVGEVASLLGCTLGIQPSVTAITLVAMGTSLPDTFASMTAAKTSQYADSAVGNVTGSNCVNVFLGLGLPWVIAAHYNANLGQPYSVPAGALGYSVFLFLITSTVCFVILLARRFVSTFIS